MVLIGNENSGMFNHADTLSTGSWQVQLAGKKKWHICPPSEAGRMYKAGDVDAFAPDYEAFPEFINASCYQVTLQPGDFIFYPHNYWHQTLNLNQFTASITDTIVTSDCHKRVGIRLHEECYPEEGERDPSRRFIFTPDKNLCSKMETCYKLWTDIFSLSPLSLSLPNDETTGFEKDDL